MPHKPRCSAQQACGLRLFLLSSPEELEAHNPSASDPDSWALVRHTSSALFRLGHNHGTGRDATGECHKRSATPGTVSKRMKSPIWHDTNTALGALAEPRQILSPPTFLIRRELPTVHSRSYSEIGASHGTL
jgi:hypothetical protein